MRFVLFSDAAASPLEPLFGESDLAGSVGVLGALLPVDWLREPVVGAREIMGNVWIRRRGNIDYKFLEDPSLVYPPLYNRHLTRLTKRTTTQQPLGLI